MSTPLRPHLIGVNTPHTIDFVFDQTGNPQGSYLIMGFRTPAEILTANGVETIQPGDCIIHSPAFRRFHRSKPGETEGFRNDWVYVDQQAMARSVKAFELPTDVLLATGEPDILGLYIESMQQELLVNDALSKHVIANQIDGMLLRIARAYRYQQKLHHELTTVERHYFPQFTALRTQLLTECEQTVTVSELAETVSLSPERFSVLYRKFFGATVYAELIAARLIRARRLLRNTNLSVKEIAVQCGWEDIHYFSRLFKRKVGVAPSAYRRRAAGPKTEPKVSSRKTP